MVVSRRGGDEGGRGGVHGEAVGLVLLNLNFCHHFRRIFCLSCCGCCRCVLSGVGVADVIGVSARACQSGGIKIGGGDHRCCCCCGGGEGGDSRGDVGNVVGCWVVVGGAAGRVP